MALLYHILPEKQDDRSKRLVRNGAGESAYSAANIIRFDREYVKTETTHALLRSIFKIGE